MSRSVAAWRAYFRQSVDAIIVRMTLQSTVATQQRKNTHCVKRTRMSGHSRPNWAVGLMPGCPQIASRFVQPLGRRQTNKPAPTTSLNMESCGFSKSPNFFPAGY